MIYIFDVIAASIKIVLKNIYFDFPLKYDILYYSMISFVRMKMLILEIIWDINDYTEEKAC